MSKSEEKGLPRKNFLYFFLGLTIFGIVVANIGINLIWFQKFVLDCQERNKNYLLAEGKKVSKNIEIFLRKTIQEIKELSQNIAFSPEKDFFIDRFLKENHYIKEISIINLEGKEIKRYSRSEYFEENYLRDFSFLEEFETAKAGNVYISRVDFMSDGNPYIKINVPIRKLEVHEVQGVLRTIFYLRESWEEFLETKIGETGKIMIVDDKGMLIADPNPARIFKKINLIELPPVKSLILGKTFEGGQYINNEKQKVFGVGTPIKTLKWGVIVEQEAKEFNFSINEARKLIIVFLITGIMVIGILIWFYVTLKNVNKKLLERTIFIEKQNQALNEIKTTLEIRIKARTKELEEITENLELQVQERTKELQERIIELEKFHQLAVGRELKMIELKKEIQKLKEELEKYKKETQN